MNHPLKNKLALIGLNGSLLVPFLFFYLRAFHLYDWPLIDWVVGLRIDLIVSFFLSPNLVFFSSV
ncbi:hypothetical protein BDW75DRAFT_212358 [Aspergillus navahoensis]